MADTGAPARKAPSRRFFILSGVAAAGGLAIGVGLLPYDRTDRARRLTAAEGATGLTTWVRIGTDDTITVFVPHADMGQGVLTALPMMLAEELDADWTHVRVERAPADVAFANAPLAQGFLAGDLSIPSFFAPPTEFGFRKLSEFMNLQITGGSTAVRLTGVFGMRKTGAAARWMLRKAASEAWGVPIDEVTTDQSLLRHARSNRSARYGEMAEAAAAYNAPDDLPLKAKTDYRIVGRDTPRFDVPGKVDGSLQYGADVRPEGLIFAAIQQAPAIGGTLVSVDDAPARALRGVSKVVQLEDAVVVLADNTWRARQGIDVLQPQWDDGDNRNLTTEGVFQGMDAAFSRNDFKTDHAAGNAEDAIGRATRTVEATYRIPYLSHAQMEPLVCVAQFKDGGLTIWAAFQDGLGTRARAARYAGMPMEKVTFNHVGMGGGFGRRGSLANDRDILEQTIDIARQADGRPVQLAWTREEDMTHGYYRQASVAHMRAGLGEDGRVTAWLHDFTEKHDPADATFVNYTIADRRTRFAQGLNPLRWGPWRSVDNTLHGFFIESFMDEIAHKAGQDPFEFRRKHLEGRHRAVLERAAEMANWGSRPAEGRARGIAIRESFNTIVAQVAEVSVDNSGRARVHNVWSAADPGEVINPATFRAQIEGGVIYGLTAALYGEITVKGGRVQERNFPDYDMVRMGDAPRQQVSIIESGAKAGGAGEPGTPAISAAVANGVFALTGQRIRELPLRKFDLRTGARAAMSS